MGGGAGTAGGGNRTCAGAKTLKEPAGQRAVAAAALLPRVFCMDPLFDGPCMATHGHASAHPACCCSSSGVRMLGAPRRRRSNVWGPRSPWADACWRSACTLSVNAGQVRAAHVKWQAGHVLSMQACTRVRMRCPVGARPLQAAQSTGRQSSSDEAHWRLTIVDVHDVGRRVLPASVLAVVRLVSLRAGGGARAWVPHKASSSSSVRSCGLLAAL